MPLNATDFERYAAVDVAHRALNKDDREIVDEARRRLKRIPKVGDVIALEIVAALGMWLERNTDDANQH
jgi:hypothetical protein